MYWGSLYTLICVEFNSNYVMNLFLIEMMLFFKDLSLIIRVMLLSLFFLPHFSKKSKSIFFFFFLATLTSKLGKFLFTKIISKPFFFLYLNS